MFARRSRVTFLWAALALVMVPGSAPGDDLPEAPRFRGRLQVLSGVGLALPQDAAGDRSLGAYVPLDVEVAMRVAGPIGLGLGAAGYAAPFNSSACPSASGLGDRPGERRGRPSALASYLDARFDLNNSRDGSWLSPWLGLRVGLVGQDGLADYAPGTAGNAGAGPCTERVVLGPFLSPRAGLDLWMGQAAVTFALGYELLPRAPAVSAEIGLTVRLF